MTLFRESKREIDSISTLTDSCNFRAIDKAVEEAELLTRNFYCDKYLNYEEFTSLKSALNDKISSFKRQCASPAKFVENINPRGLSFDELIQLRREMNFLDASIESVLTERSWSK